MKLVIKKGKENVATDALSRFTSSEFTLMAISSVPTDHFGEIQLSWETDLYLH